MKEQLLTGDDWKPLKHDCDGRIVKKGVKLELDLSMNNHHTNKSRRNSIYFVLCGNTNVFVAPRHAGYVLEPADFDNLSNHDVCWRDAIQKYLNNIYFKWSEEICGGRAPIDMDSRCFMGLFTTCELVKVEMVHNPRDSKDDVGRYRLTSLESWVE
jgi:hypothetical protein